MTEDTDYTIQDHYYIVEIMMKRKKRKYPFMEVIVDASKAADFFRIMIQKKDREVLSVIGLDNRGKITYYETVNIGVLSHNLYHPREIFKAAILSNSQSIILAHNHPSGDARPSDEDKAMTKRMIDAGKILAIEVLDHLIIGEDGGYSIKDNKPVYYGGSKNER